MYPLITGEPYKHQKLNQTTGGCVFGGQLGFRQVQVTNFHLWHHHRCIFGVWICPECNDDDMLDTSYYLHLPKAALNAKSTTKLRLCCRLVEFLLFNAIYNLIYAHVCRSYRCGFRLFHVFITPKGISDSKKAFCDVNRNRGFCPWCDMFSILPSFYSRFL